MPIARIPPDLRDRSDLSLADVQRIVDLRRDRKKLTAKAETLDAELKATRDTIAKSKEEEQALLAAD